MAQVQTARGPVEAASLGQVLMHEHVFVLTAEVVPRSDLPAAVTLGSVSMNLARSLASRATSGSSTASIIAMR